MDTLFTSEILEFLLLLLLAVNIGIAISSYFILDTRMPKLIGIITSILGFISGSYVLYKLLRISQDNFSLILIAAMLGSFLTICAYLLRYCSKT